MRGVYWQRTCRVTWSRSVTVANEKRVILKCPKQLQTSSLGVGYVMYVMYIAYVNKVSVVYRVCTVNSFDRGRELSLVLSPSNTHLWWWHNAGKPDSPYNLQFINATHDSVTLAWQPGFNGGLPQRFQVRYGEVGGEGMKYEDVVPKTASVYTVKGTFTLLSSHTSVTIAIFCRYVPVTDRCAVYG